MMITPPMTLSEIIRASKFNQQTPHLALSSAQISEDGNIFPVGYSKHLLLV
uniref:Uncharacterized protein n=1 Tax=Arion vulgaris TaxID=1028688 RepID=A0A0B7A847_9EUPU